MFAFFLTVLFTSVSSFLLVIIVFGAGMMVRRHPKDVAALRAQQHSVGTTDESSTAKSLLEKDSRRQAKRFVTFRDWIDLDDEADARRGLSGSAVAFDSTAWMRTLIRCIATIALEGGGDDQVNKSIGAFATRIAHAKGLACASGGGTVAGDGTGAGRNSSTADTVSSVFGARHSDSLLDGLLSGIHVASSAFLVPTVAASGSGRNGSLDQTFTATPRRQHAAGASPDRLAAEASPPADMLTDTTDPDARWSLPVLDSEIKTRYVVEDGPDAIPALGEEGTRPPILELECAISWNARVELEVSADINPLATLIARYSRGTTKPDASRAAVQPATQRSSSVVNSSSFGNVSAAVAATTHHGVVGQCGAAVMMSLEASRKLAPDSNAAMMRLPPPRPSLSIALTPSMPSSESSSPPAALPSAAVARIPRNIVSMHVNCRVTHISFRVDIRVLFFPDRVEIRLPSSPGPALRCDTIITAGGGRSPRLDASYLSCPLHAGVGRAVRQFTEPKALVLFKERVSPLPPVPAATVSAGLIKGAAAAGSSLNALRRASRTGSVARQHDPEPLPSHSGAKTTSSDPNPSKGKCGDTTPGGRRFRWRTQWQIVAPVVGVDEWHLDLLRRPQTEASEMLDGGGGRRPPPIAAGYHRDTAIDATVVASAQRFVSRS